MDTELPELTAACWKVVAAGPYAWRSDSSRQGDFTDFGHFPWVHPGLLGDSERPVVPDHSVPTDGHVLHYEVVRKGAVRARVGLRRTRATRSQT